MWNQIRKKLDFPESYISITLGFLVVLVAGILTYNYFSKNQITQSQEEKAEQEEKTKQEELAKPKDLPAKYTVKTSDRLWKIAEEYYGSGYNWVSIVQENSILASNPDYLEEGWELNIPQAEIIRPAGDISAAETVQPKEYTVQKGDTLWAIAERETGSGYNWTKIAQYNALQNPDLIYSGNVLKIPR